MTPQEFVAEFEDDQMPDYLGPLISRDTHEPPFKKRDLRRMEAAGLIVLDTNDWTYRLTLKAAQLADMLRHTWPEKG